MRPRRHLGVRVAQMAGGTFLLGVSVTLALRSGLGAAPWDVFHEGLAQRTRLEIGAVAVLVGLAAFIAWVPLRLRPGIGTIVNMVLVGSVVALTLPVVAPAHHLAVQLAMTAVSVALAGIGVALFMRADLGAGSRDGIAIGLAHRGIPIWAARVAVDCTLVGIGSLLGGVVGFGTLCAALLVGPVVAATLHVFARRDQQDVTLHAALAALHEPLAVERFLEDFVHEPTASR